MRQRRPLVRHVALLPRGALLLLHCPPRRHVTSLGSGAKALLDACLRGDVPAVHAPHRLQADHVPGCSQCAPPQQPLLESAPQEGRCDTSHHNGPSTEATAWPRSRRALMRRAGTPTKGGSAWRWRSSGEKATLPPQLEEGRRQSDERWNRKQIAPMKGSRGGARDQSGGGGMRGNRGRGLVAAGGRRATNTRHILIQPTSATLLQPQVLATRIIRVAQTEP